MRHDLPDRRPSRAGRGALIEARDVHKSFGQTPALRGRALSVAAGEILAVMGPSGSGKSTLLHCLAGIFTPDSGEVWFDGPRLDELERRQAHRAAAHRLRLRLPVRPAGPRAERGRQHRAAAAAEPGRAQGRVREGGVLAGAARAGRASAPRRTGELSGGQAQRVALARALVAAARRSSSPTSRPARSTRWPARW